MAKLTLEETKPGVSVPTPASAMDRFAARNSAAVDGLGSIDTVRRELDEIYAMVNTFRDMEPDEVMTYCSGYSARLGEIRMRIERVEDVLQHWKPVRTREVEPAIREIHKQFDIHSRLLSVRELDWKMTRGMM